MAMIQCPECGQSVSDKAEKCIHCGCPLGGAAKDTNGTLVVYGYTGWFINKPKVRIYLDGQYIGDVSYKAKTKEIPITKPTIVEFKCSGRSTSVRVLPGEHSEVHLEHDKVWGRILAELRSY